MGSDDGAKGRDGRSWWSAVAFLFFFVGPMLGLEQYLAAIPIGKVTHMGRRARG